MPSQAEKLPLLGVMGEGQVEVVPDTAVVSLGVTARAEEANAAYQEIATVLNQILGALTGMGIRPEQMQSGRVDLRPLYEDERLVGYEAAATLRITLPDPAMAGAVIDAAVAAGANTVQGISFEVRDPGPAEARALRSAIDDARRAAAAMAQALGVRLGPVWRVEAEPGPGVIPPTARFAVAEGVPVLPGRERLTRRVRVEYLLAEGQGAITPSNGGDRT